MNFIRLRRAALALTPLAALAVAAAPSPVSAAPPSGVPAHHRDHPRATGAVPAATSGNLLYNGGSVLTAPRVYLTFWGPEWAAGFSSGGYSSATAENYLSAFFTRVGGSPWAQTDAQYCQTTNAIPVATGSQSCPAGATHAANPSNILAGTWVDSGHAVPASPLDPDIAAEARAAVNHFGFNPQAMYFLMSPPGKSQSGFGSSWCAWHGSDYASGVGQWAYTYLPFQPDAGAKCGVNSVNAVSDSFGHGYFDGYSVIAGHEFAETVTDPFPNSGWVDSSGNENGDKCQWQGIGNVTFGDQYFAMQPTWSNAISGCAMTSSIPGPPGPSPTPTPTPTPTPAPTPGAQGAGSLHPLTPARILDSRTGLGGLSRLASGQRAELNVLGVGGVPASAVQAVVLNVTAADADMPGFIAVYAGGTTWPGNSNLNFGPGQASTNLVQAPVGSNGRVAFANGSPGGVALVADVMGWVDDGGPASAAGRLTSLAPQRIFDSRNSGAMVGPGTGNAISLQVTGVGGVPGSGVSAVVLNVTATGGSGGGFLAVYPTGAGWPGNSNVNFSPGQTIPNRVIASVGAGGQVSIVTSTSTHVIVDVGGWYNGAAGTFAGTYTPVLPSRLLDTRGAGAVGPGGTIVLTIAGRAGIPAAGARTVALNVTATNVTAPSFIAVYPHASSWQVTSDLNTGPGVTSTNMVIVQLGPDGMIVLANAGGSADLIVDVAGWYS